MDNGDSTLRLAPQWFGKGGLTILTISVSNYSSSHLTQSSPTPLSPISDGAQIMDQTPDSRFEDAITPEAEPNDAASALDLLELLGDSLPEEAQPANGLSVEWLLNRLSRAETRS